MHEEDINKLVGSIHDKEEEPDNKLGKASLQKSSMTGVTVTGTCYPKKNCKKCFGRGYVGRNTETGQFVNCSCTFRKNENISQMPTLQPTHQDSNISTLNGLNHLARHMIMHKEEELSK